MSLLSAAADKGQRSGAPTADFSFDASAPADLQKKYSWILSVPKPTIAAINGHAVGLGFVIPLYCDIRLASDASRFCTIFGKRGLVAEYGMAWMLPRIVGLANAADLLFTARVIDAQEALRIGLVQRVIADADFRGAVQAYAEDIANNVSPRSLRIMKKQIYDALSQPLGAAIDVAYKEMAGSFSTEDFREGVQHFLEKRAAAFTGR
jgi:enoyl-CoA hydratase/carnithine racemase